MAESHDTDAVDDGTARSSDPAPERRKPGRRRKARGGAPVVRVEIYTGPAPQGKSRARRVTQSASVEARAYGPDDQEGSREGAELAGLASRLAAAQLELDERERRLSAESERVRAEVERLAARQQEAAERDADFAAVEMVDAERRRLERRSRQLDEMEETVRERFQELAASEADFELRLDEIERREHALDELERRLEQKESDLAAYVAQVQGEIRRREFPSLA